MTTQLSSILLGQWQASPRLRGIVTDILQEILDDGIDAAGKIELMQFIPNAKGVWLDYLGKRLGIERPATSDPAQDLRFGFDEAGVPFNLAPFRGSTENDAVYPLPDAIYLRFVQARAVMVLGDGTIFSFKRAVNFIDPVADVVDNRDMTVSITTAFQDYITLADSIGALPRTAGVRIIFA